MLKNQNPKDLPSIIDNSDDEDEFKETFKSDFKEAVEHKREIHQKWNYCYLQYKGILAMNEAHGEDYMQSIGLQINVPRTFMTIESIRPTLSEQPLDIGAQPLTKDSEETANKVQQMLKGEWQRSKANDQKAEAEFDALLFGTGYLLSEYHEDKIKTDKLKEYDEQGRPVMEEGELTRYKGMRLRRLNPYHVFEDPTATTDDPNKPGSWNYCYVYSIWDYDEWEAVCEAKGYNTDNMEKGGMLEDFDSVRRKIDALYKQNTSDDDTQVRTRTDGKYLSENNPGSLQKERPDWDNKIMVVERFEEDSYSICSGKNWTINHKGANPYPDKRINIKPIRDYRVPGEFLGIGEAEVLRWQQYEENKIHNLSYLQVLMNTVQRYGVIEEHLKDPTEARMDNPLQPIRLKNKPGLSVNDAIQPLGQASSNDYPQPFMEEVKQTGQSATGITDFFIGANKSAAGTATEANRLAGATADRIRQKIYNIEKRDLVPLLEHWLASIPHFYDETMDVPLFGDDSEFVKFVPFTRDKNNDADLVTQAALEVGAQEGETIEEIYKNAGYTSVVFVSDLLQSFRIEIKTATAEADRQDEMADFMELIKTASNINIHMANMGQNPKFDVGGLMEELMRQFKDIVDDPEDFILDSNDPQKTGVPQQAVQQNQPEQDRQNRNRSNVQTGNRQVEAKDKQSPRNFGEVVQNLIQQNNNS